MKALQKPFPPMSGLGQRLRSAFLISLFVFLFLYIFQPFGISTIKGSILLVTFLYGLITLCCLLLTQVLMPRILQKYFDENSWNVGREILHTMVNVLLIALGNFLFSAYLNFFPWSTSTLLLFIGFTLAVGAFPVVIQVLIRQNIYHRRNAATAQADNQVISERKADTQALAPICISSDEGQIEYEGPSSELLAVEASGNYVLLHIWGSPKPKLIRATLSSLEEYLPDIFFRSHRSWLINLEAVEKVEGNARGYTVKFDSELEAPVSRSKLKTFDQLLRAPSRSA